MYNHRCVLVSQIYAYVRKRLTPLSLIYFDVIRTDKYIYICISIVNKKRDRSIDKTK